jgi:hypothetical protein
MIMRTSPRPGGTARRVRSSAGGRLLVAATTAAAVFGLLAAGSAAAAPGRATAGTAGGSPAGLSISSGDSPAGFWYGTDSWTVTGTGSAPYHEPVIGGAYGGYIGMTGSWAHWYCADKLAYSPANAKQASTDYRTYHAGIGTGLYWFMGGPGVDPHYNGTVAEAYAWGKAQAIQAVSKANGNPGGVDYRVLFADVELPGYAPGISPAQDNGWNSVYTSPCSGQVKANYIDPNVDRATLNGFTNYITAHSYQPGVYSAPSIWASIFGTGSPAKVTNLYEWTYTAFTSSLSRHPAGWCLSGTSTCAQFFGGITSRNSHAVMWQWSGGGGSYNGHGDFDQIDANRTP